MRYKTCVVFGGSGFIGSHFILHLLKNNLADRILIADIAEPRSDFNIVDARLEYFNLDVRTNFDTWCLPQEVDLIANFAAVHREPGHELFEYYETNILGAENICSWAELVGCNTIIFTSSIAPYGPSEEVKTEDSLPTPHSPYGGSKLVAEKIHMVWEKANSNRVLVIVRPGVVFGPGERGNVTRLIKATLRRYFFYMGNCDTRKSGGYVKELILTMFWALSKFEKCGGVFLYNFMMKTPPSVKNYVDTVCEVAGIKRWIPSLPFRLLLLISYAVEGLAVPLGIKQPISPVRIRKLVRSNNIQPAVLISNGYVYKYNLLSAMQDWRADRPSEWR